MLPPRSRLPAARSSWVRLTDNLLAMTRAECADAREDRQPAAPGGKSRRRQTFSLLPRGIIDAGVEHHDTRTADPNSYFSEFCGYVSD
jgi:hypothetical protein